LFSEAEDIMDFIRKHINKRVIFNGQLENEERWDYPLEAVRELVINMVLHRDYTASYDSVLKVYDDHIEFYNPGATPPEIDLPHLLSNDYVSQPRNKLIAEVFKAGGLIEKYGSGIRRVLEAFHVFGLPQPEFQLLSTGFRVKIFSGLSGGLRDAAIVSEPLVPVLKKIQDDVGVITTSKAEVPAADLSQTEGGQRGGQRGGQTGGQRGGQTPEVFLLSDAQKAVLELIRKNNQITRKELSGELKISESAIQKHINQLKLKKILVRVGGDFGGYWEVKGR
jgi:ATP-dependent DNA helicase RecG